MIKEIIYKIKKAFFKNDVFYINSSESLPPPLTKEEENDLYNGINQGNEKCKNNLVFPLYLFII